MRNKIATILSDILSLRYDKDITISFDELAEDEDGNNDTTRIVEKQ